MAISLPDARQLSDEALEVLRLRALRGVELGFTEAQMADVLGVTRDTVSRWWTAYASGGVEALPHDRSGRPLGSGRLLSDEQASHIQSLIDEKTPEQLGIPSALWTRRAVGKLIHKEFSIDLAVRTVGEYLRRWGYTPKKPTASRSQARHRRGCTVAGRDLSGYRETGCGGRTPRFTGAMRRVCRRTITQARGIPRRANRRRWRCPDHTSA